MNFACQCIGLERAHLPLFGSGRLEEAAAQVSHKPRYWAYAGEPLSVSHRAISTVRENLRDIPGWKR